MKKELIVSALLMVGPATQLHASDISTARHQVLQQRQDLLELEFVSARKNGQEETVLKFYRADNNYTYDGFGGMEYEVVVSYKNKKTGKSYNDDNQFYVKRLDENTFQMFDCNSTARCSDSYDNMVFHIFDTPKGKLLKFKQSSEVGYLKPNEDSKKYFQVK